MEAIFLNSDSERDENNSDSDSESGSSDEDVTWRNGSKSVRSKAMKRNVQKAAMRSKAKRNCQLTRKICREGEGTGELQLMGLKFSGRSTKTSIHSNLHGFQNSLNDRESLLMQPNFS